MQLRNRTLTALSALYLIAVAFTQCPNAMALQAKFGRSFSSSLQEPQQQPDNKQPDPATPRSGVFTGTILKNGSNYQLKDVAGNVYTLDSPEKAKPFENKSVKITGTLEADSKLLHVATIEEVSA